MEEEEPLPISKTNPKCNPAIILGPKAVGNENVSNIIYKLLALWKTFRYPGIGKKNIPCFVGLSCKTIRKNWCETFIFNIPTANNKTYKWL